ncbi:purine-cytosine permease family protein [Pseudonocardia adelaidensis]|uniref:Cytosine permease n=1 Tax=Pseudonocardia adelaidensis TaxID=648754 RepID=A0ABP9NCK9_9PSEU
MTAADHPPPLADDADPPSTLADTLQDHALEPVPAAERKSVMQLVIVQIGWNISVSSFLVGGVVGGGTTFSEGLLAILLGNVLLVAVAYLIGMVGFRTGLTSYLASRAVFGTRGSIIVTMLLGVVAMGFIGVLADTWGTAVNKLIPAVPGWAFVLAFALAITSTAIFGFKGLQRYSAIAVPIEIAIALLALVAIARTEDGFAGVVAVVPAAGIGFGAAVGAVMSTWITGAALVSDVTRYARSGRHVLLGVIAGFVVGAGTFELIATLSAMSVGNSNFVVVMQSLGLLAPAVVMLVLALWNTADNNLYSASLAFTSASDLLGFRVPKWVWTIVAIVIAVLVALSGAAAQFGVFLGVVGVVAPPFAGVLIAHFWLVARGVSGARLLSEAPTVRWEALLCWLVASLLAWSTGFLLTDAIEGLVAGAVLYGIVGSLLRSRQTEATSVSSA